MLQQSPLPHLKCVVLRNWMDVLAQSPVDISGTEDSVSQCIAWNNSAWLLEGDVTGFHMRPEGYWISTRLLPAACHEYYSVNTNVIWICSNWITPSSFTAVLQHLTTTKEHILAPMGLLHRADLSLKSVGSKWNNSIMTSMYKVYEISSESFSLKCWGWFFYVTHHPSPTAYIAPVAINKLQENYFSTVSQCFSYLPATAVTYPKALIWDVYGWKYDCLCSSVAEEHYPIMLQT